MWPEGKGSDNSHQRGLTAHVLSDSGASHKFVRPEFLRKMETLTGATLAVKEGGKIKVTTANAVIEVLLGGADIEEIIRYSPIA
jgi:hypothetical protein